MLTSEDPELDPIMINDNLIDVEVTPTEPGRSARVFWRPQTASNTLDGQVMTAPATSAATFPPRMSISTTSDGRISVSGTIPRNVGRQLQTLTIADPAAFARTALIQALERAAVSVRAPITGFAVEPKFLGHARVDVSQVAFADGRGGAPSDRATPTAVVALLSWWPARPDFAAVRSSLPILGVDASLAGVARGRPGQVKVFAKTGHGGHGDSLNGQLVIEGKGLAGT